MATPRPIPPSTDNRPIDAVLNPLQRFLRVEAAGGILLLVCTVIALIWANSAWAESYDEFWHTYIKVGFGDATLKLSLAHFVNDGLMAIFFFVVGLEIKRELLAGELASPRKAAIPIAGAIGGMIVPALVYVALCGGGEASRGWGIPMATDIAFAVGVMVLLGKRVPTSLKVMLTAIAIVDDIGAVLVIAIFYTSEINVTTLVIANAFVALSALANWSGIRNPIVYALIGIAIWLLLLSSGVHATIGGVLLAFTIPARIRIDAPKFTRFARKTIDDFEAAGGHDANILANSRRQSLVHGLEIACEHAQTPLNRLETGLHPWVAFAIMPIFALANAGVALGSGFVEALASGVGTGIALGLFLGKPIGIVLFIFVAVKVGLGRLPDGVGWAQVAATGLLAGIGFTMSLFIANLAFAESDMLQLAKVGILTGSFVAGATGLLVLHLTCRTKG